jgi:hypothetical protein
MNGYDKDNNNRRLLSMYKKLVAAPEQRIKSNPLGDTVGARKITALGEIFAKKIKIGSLGAD